MKSHDSNRSAGTDDHTDSPLELRALKEDLARVRSDLASISSNLMDRGKHAIQGAGSDIGHYAQDSVKHAQDFVRERPVGTALVALGVGVLVGILIQKR
jgi:ElaB/YqjD/DUF883 family membrane-anchored ribosome-binding protein